MLYFFTGFIVGTLCGISITSLCVASKKRDDAYDSADFYKKMK